MKSMISVYIHIPFCKELCSYCDFSKVFYEKNWVEKYLVLLEKEIKDRYMDEKVKTLYIGGGTPSCLSMSNLNKLMNIIKLFKIDKDAEVTIECNVNDLSYKMIDLFKKHGVNRLSIGIQSFNDNNLKFLNRSASYEHAKEMINYAKQRGITNINVDIIYALSNQSLKTLKKDLKMVNKLGVTHISTYSLMIEEHTVLYNNNVQPIDEGLDHNMYKMICRYLKRKKFIHYEVSNFAKKGYESVHNLTYWHNEQYYGFGLGASGYIDNIRYTNTKNLSKYLDGNYHGQENILSKQDQMDYEIMLRLRTKEGINLKKFYHKYNVNFQSIYKIEELLKNKDLIYKKGNIFINPDKLYIMNEILLKII